MSEQTPLQPQNAFEEPRRSPADHTLDNVMDTVVALAKPTVPGASEPEAPSASPSRSSGSCPQRSTSTAQRSKRSTPTPSNSPRPSPPTQAWRWRTCTCTRRGAKVAQQLQRVRRRGGVQGPREAVAGQQPRAARRRADGGRPGPERRRSLVLGTTWATAVSGRPWRACSCGPAAAAEVVGPGPVVEQAAAGHAGAWRRGLTGLGAAVLRRVARTVSLYGVAGEAYAFLVGAPVFKTGEGRYPVLVGSIPIRLRHVL